MRPVPKSSQIHLTAIHALRLVVGATILYVGWLILTPYAHYFPADFSYGFLRNKADYFYSSPYFLGFYSHVASAPLALLCGTLQMSRTFRQRWPVWHRRIGLLYCGLVLLLAAPGGLVMSTKAFGGISSVICFALISLLAWLFTLLGWRAARQHRYAVHGRWMTRSYAMLCSAVVLRLVHYVMRPLSLDAVLTYQLAAWLSWLPTLVALEWSFVRRESGNDA